MKFMPVMITDQSSLGLLQTYTGYSSLSCAATCNTMYMDRAKYYKTFYIHNL